jgi:hypothetical protein
MSFFKVNNRKLEPGRYEFSYGRGRNKLVSVAWYNDLGRSWKTEDPAFESTTLQDLKALWGKWAIARYAGDPEPDATPAPKGPPVFVPPVPKGPPVFKPPVVTGPPVFKPRPQIEHQFAADPFDVRLRYPSDHDDPNKRQRHTPLGTLVEIEAWCKRHEADIKKVYDLLPRKDHPYSPFTDLIASVRACIARELPPKKEPADESQVPEQPAEPSDPAPDALDDALALYAAPGEYPGQQPDAGGAEPDQPQLGS